MMDLFGYIYPWLVLATFLTLAVWAVVRVCRIIRRVYRAVGLVGLAAIAVTGGLVIWLCWPLLVKAGTALLKIAGVVVAGMLLGGWKCSHKDAFGVDYGIYDPEECGFGPTDHYWTHDEN
jgi:hypothetical protein